MTLPPPPKSLSSTAILVLAANTMNGPGITTLPDVAANAGRTLYILLIALSAGMAAFVCRRMVYAMWHNTATKAIATTVVTREGSVELLDVKDKYYDANESSFGSSTSSSTETSQLLLMAAGKEKNTSVPHLPQPILELSSIVGQSREAFDQDPDNDEFCNVVDDETGENRSKRRTLPPSTHVAFVMVASALCLGLAQMMLCAAILDGMFVAIFGKSCALGWPSYHDDDGGSDGESTLTSSSWIYCSTHSSMQPFSDSGTGSGIAGADDVTSSYPVSLLSMGWVLAASASVAMGMVDLSEMMHVQYFLFGCLVVSAIRFSGVLRGMMMSRMEDGVGIDDNNDSSIHTHNADISGSGDEVGWFLGPNPFQAVGPIMFNFAFVVTSPPSAARATTEESAYKALSMSCLLMGILYVMVGLSGADASNAITNGTIPGNNSNLLSLILLSGNRENGGPSMFDLCMIGLFGLSTVASVPVYCLLAKETLINDAGVAPLPSFILSNVLPWILVALTYNAAFFEAFVNWSGLLILGYANFSLPLLLDLKLKKVRAANIAKVQPVDDDDDSSTTITKWIFISVTASITMVIVMSIFDNLTLSFGAFVLFIGLMSHVKV